MRIAGFKLIDLFVLFQIETIGSTAQEDISKETGDLFESVVESTPKFLTLFDQIDDKFLDKFDDVYLEFYNQLDNRTKECDALLGEVSSQTYLVIIKFLNRRRCNFRSTTA